MRIRGPYGVDSWKKPEVDNLVLLYLYMCIHIRRTRVLIATVRNVISHRLKFCMYLVIWHWLQFYIVVYIALNTVIQIWLHVAGIQSRKLGNLITARMWNRTVEGISTYCKFSDAFILYREYTFTRWLFHIFRHVRFAILMLTSLLMFGLFFLHSL